ncbi:DUF445 domain-containing protein [Corynebacterium lubricantis]|uniref:DUF445 domain-containing protein n=1 Tax=Corynebacterium lubricantis TaxID=541095 RepID=UPI0003A042C4|nr:DUF445 family protein [Corynebacterium lubricantis]
MGRHALSEESATEAATTTSMPGMSAEKEAERRRALRNHQAFATGLLLIAAVIFLTCSWWQSQGTAPGWIGYVRAAAEAGMIGGIADWFAVTALFRHPMKIPIPHTALIPKKKDQLGDALSGFVGENFLNAELITEKVNQANIPEKVGQWMAKADNAELISRKASEFGVYAIRSLDPKDAEDLINSQVIARIAEPTWGPIAGRALEGLIADGKTEPVVDALISWGRDKVDGMEDSIVSLIDERMPNWAPRFAKELVGERVYKELVKFMEDVDTDQNHQARQAIRKQLNQLAQDLQFDGEMITKVENFKSEVMGSKVVQGAASEIWTSVSTSLIDALSDPSSTMRRRIAELSVHWGNRIQTDEEVRSHLDKMISGTASYLADNYAGEVTGIISETIQRWDADEASEKIELMVGKDLQYIRVNGTVVGALAGLVIYTVNQLLFGV